MEKREGRVDDSDSEELDGDYEWTCGWKKGIAKERRIDVGAFGAVHEVRPTVYSGV